MTKSLIRRFSIFLTGFCILLNGIYSVQATEISSFNTDDTTGWSRWDYHCHMGQKNTTYTYASSAIKSEYSSYVQSGIAMWGSLISCSEVSSNAKGLITETTDWLEATAKTTVTYNSSKHITGWTITIYPLFNFNSTEAGQNRTLAHEIGHVYGLGHVTNSSQIMYGEYSATRSVTASDQRGMRVMTHEHTHTGSYNSATAQYSSTSHKTRCTTCRAYSILTCTFTSNWHSGTSHYYQFNCACGNTSLVTFPCTGGSCIQPFSSINSDIS